MTLKDWLPLIFSILLSIIIVGGILIIENKENKEASQFCEDELNGELSISSNKICYVEQDKIIYEVKIGKYKDEWRVFVE